MSIHKKLEKIRKPRVHINYEVETNGASVKKELPFVIGVTGDFTGHNTDSLKSLKDRRFIQIDSENYDDILKRMNPKLSFTVENSISDDSTEMAVDLSFTSMGDFEPDAIVEQVAPLKSLMDTRNKLRDLLTKVDRSDELEGILEDVLSNTDQLDKLVAELKSEGDKK